MRKLAELRTERRDAAARSIVHPLAPHLRITLRTTLIILMISSVLYWLLCAYGTLTAHNVGNDFLSYYTAALALRDNPHANVFDLATLRSAAAAHGAPLPALLYLYPPLLAMMLIPLTFLPYSTALAIWTTLGFSLWLGGTILLMRWAMRLLSIAPRTSASERVNSAGDIALFAFAMTLYISLTFSPLLDGLLNGQVSSLIFFLLVLALALAVRYPRLAGAILALAIWIKLYPVLLIGYYALQRRWRVVAGAVAAAALLLAGMLLFIGWQGISTFSAIANNGAIAGSNPSNLLLLHMPLLIAFVLGRRPDGALAATGYIICASIGAVFAGGVLHVLRRQQPTSAEIGDKVPDSPMRSQHLLGFSWALCTMLLLSPVAWEHTYAWLLPSCVICLSVALQQRLIRIHLPSRPASWEQVKANSANAVLLVSLMVAYAALALPAYLSAAGKQAAQLMQLNSLLLLFHPVGGLMLWTANARLLLQAPTQPGSRLHLGGEPAQADHVAASRAHLETRFLALALLGYFAVVGVVEGLYWGLFLFISTHK